MSIEASIEKWVVSPRFKKFMARLYGWGASVVVMGALFKLEHWAGADYMLSAGLITEAIIFFFYAFEPEEKSGNPLLIYPGMGGSQQNSGYEDSPFHRGRRLGAGSSVSHSVALAKFDEMLENADINPDILAKFGEGIRKFGQTAENINSLDEVYNASKSYLNTIKTADESLGKLTKAYESTITKVTHKSLFKYKAIAESLNIIEEESRSYQQQMVSLNKNLSELNSVYKMQTKGAGDYMRDMAISAAETKKYREQITELNKNLMALNKYYKGMRSVMKS